jgi:hypothetical protein
MIQIPQDPQVVFDIVVEHALNQNKRCTNEKGNCCYRYKGKKCFAGALIPNDQYDPDMEGKSWEKLFQDGIVSGKNKGLITILQSIHDIESTNDWVECLRKVGKQFCLNLDKLPPAE